MENQSESSNSNFGEERNLSEKFDSMEELSKSSNSSFEDKSTSSASNIMKMQYGSSNIEKWLNEESSLSILKHDIPETSMKQVSLNQNIHTNCSDCRTQTICLNCVSQIFQDFLIKAQLHSSNIENSPESDEIWSFSSIQKYDISEISVEQASLNRAVYFREILQEFFMNAQYRLRFPNIENFSESEEKSPFISISKHDVPEISLELLSSNQTDCLRKSFEMDIVDGKIENIYTDNVKIEDLYVEDDSSSLETASDKELKSDKELESDKELGSDKESGSNKELESDKEFELEKLRSAKESGSDKELESIIELKSAKELESDKELGSDKELISIESLELDKAEIQETLEMQERNSNFTSIAECYWKENDYEFNKLHPPSICSNLSRKNLKNRQEYPPFSPVSLDDVDEIDSASIENMEATDYTDVEDSTSESKMFLVKLRQVEADFKAQTKDVELYRNYSTLPIILKTDKRNLSESSIMEPTKSAEFSCMTSIESRIATLHTLKVDSGYASMEISGKEKSADLVTNINDATLNPSTSMSDNLFKIISDKKFMDGTKSISEVENRLSRDEINKSLKTKLSSTKSSMEPSFTKSSPMEPSEDDQVKNMKTQESKNSTKNVCVNTPDSHESEPADNQAETTNNKKFENAMDPASLTNQPSETIPDMVKDIPPKLRTTDETQKTDNQVETTSNMEFENAMNPTSLTNQSSETIPDMVKDIPPKLRTTDETQKTDNQAEITSNMEFENAMNPTSLTNQPSETIPDMVKDIPPKLRTTDETQKTDNQAEITSNKEIENAMDPASLTNQSSETIPDIVKDIPPKLKTTDETQKTDQAEITSNKESENAMNPTSLTNQFSETISDIVKDIPPKLRTIGETQKADNQAKITSNKKFENAMSLTNQSSKITSNILKDIFSKFKTTDETQETDNLAEIMGDEEFENAMDFTSSLTNEHDKEPEEYPDKIKKEMKCSPKCCLIILLSFIILTLSLFLFMLQYYSRPSDINQNDEYVDTFAIAIVELEEGILDHDATVRVLTEYLERDTPLLKVVALIGDTSVDKTYTVDIIKKRLRKRRNNSSSPSLPSFVVLENLRAEHSTVIIDYVETYQEAYSNQEFTILAIFKVEQIDDDLMRTDIDRVINKVKDIFVEANIIMKIIPFKPLSEDALEKYIINTAENIGRTLSQDQIDYYKRRLIEDDTDCQACCY
ncbi:uncharacterized protein LOC126849873 [Cataglyphis hispanica]|uniref:uncharacterized protein LOC126849873 n=1 Tax=Cataglyphis hispanica TaxID=1086592 RepID=UPI00217FB490|nr:uncharacterized protein LOC126849873 [Cataglyphis hispanica]XP_050448156.1 uncharacterized protein LOC126849873 [Cataglyphis hispanica]XP_050448157.1 uncharacterized protein LOC126849873 [Cataglyphis hispanica]